VSAAAWAAPSAAALRGDVWSSILGFLDSIWSGIAWFFGGILSAIQQALESLITIPIGAVQGAWNSFEAWANQYGPLAPLLVVGMIGLFLAIAAFFIWLLVKYSVSQVEQTGEEVEEGV
jgi:hypothetical protein